MLSKGQRSSGWPRYQLTNLSQISIFFFFNTSRDTDATLMSIMHPSLAEEEEEEEEVEEEVEQEQGVTPREGQRR